MLKVILNFLTKIVKAIEEGQTAKAKRYLLLHGYDEKKIQEIRDRANV